MAKKYGMNMADTHLVVGSIEVIEEIKGNGIRTIQDKVEAIQQTLNFIPEQIDYWTQLSSDGLITPVEKKTLKAQWEQIKAMYTKLRQIVEQKSLIYKDYWISYLAAYNNLKAYLEEQLLVFDDMYSNTKIDSRETFNNYFTIYYTQENSCNMSITGAGIGYQEYQFAVGTETTYPGESSTDWQDAPPTKTTEGQYIWMRTRWIENDDVTAWSYARLTGNKGDNGSSFTPLYSASNIPYTEDPTLWSTTYDPKTHVYMCIKTVTPTGTTYSIPSRFVGENGTSITILDSYDTYEQLIAAHPTGNVGDGYLVDGNLYVWLKNATTWKNVGNIKGPQGNSIQIKEARVQYQMCSSGTQPDEDKWLDDLPELEQGYFLWTKTYILYSDGTSLIAYSVSYIGTDANVVTYTMRIKPRAVTFAEDGSTLYGEKLRVEKIRTDQVDSYQTDYGYITVQEDDHDEQDYGVSDLDTTGVYDEKKTYAAKYKPFLLQIGTDTSGARIVLGMSTEVATMFFERVKEG